MRTYVGTESVLLALDIEGGVLCASLLHVKLPLDKISCSIAAPYIAHNSLTMHRSYISTLTIRLDNLSNA